MSASRFIKLLSLYLDDNLPDDEREELMRLVREGSHDETIRDRISALLLNSASTEDMDPQKARKMLRRILTAANEKEKTFRLRPVTGNWRWVAVVTVLVVAGYTASRILRREPPPPQKITLHKKKPESAIFTGKQFVHLPDGSTVLLNEGSKLTYSTSFGKRGREVALTGEGYFDVRHDPSRPFTVVTGNVTTTALGTAFNVRAYPGQQEIRVTVSRGKVRVGNDQGQFDIITPDQQISVNTATNDFTKLNVKAEAAGEWKSEYLILDDVSLEEAARTIENKYKVKIILANDDLKKCRITATFLDGENLDQVLTVVSGVVQATYLIQSDGSVKIEGKGCKSNF